MKRIFLFIIVLFPFVLTAQETKEVVIKNAVGRYVERFSVLKSDTTIKHGNYRRMDFFGGAPKLLGSYKMGKKNGRWQEFSVWDVFMISLGNYTDDKRTGLWTFYSKLNEKEQEYDYTKKKLIFYKKDPSATYTIIKGKDTIKNAKLDQPPLYLGGNISVMSYIFSHMVYPEVAFKKGIHGTVQVSCLITKDGHLGKVWVSKKVEKTLDAAAIKIMKELPNTWLPAIEKGKPVAAIYLHEIPFILENNKASEMLRHNDLLTKMPLMKLRLFVTILFSPLFVSTFLHAQNAAGVSIASELGKKSYSIDTNAAAVILLEKGVVSFEQKEGSSTQKYRVHKIVKILKTTGFSLATIKELYPNSTGKPATTKIIDATTYYQEDGKTKQTKLDKSTVENNRQSKDYSEVAFTMPDVKTGCIIDYEYEISGPAHNILPFWEFQGKTPKLASEYEIVLAKDMGFTELSQPHLKVKHFDSEKESGNEHTSIYDYSRKDANSLHHVWGRRNVPALKPEAFVNNLDNFKEVLVIGLGKEYNAKETNGEWKDLTDELWNDEHFGKMVTAPNSRIQTFVDSITRNDKTSMAKATTIFNYCRVAFDYNNNEGILARRPIDQVFSNRIASEAEINLVMMAMMRMAKLNASPVILSKINTPPASPFLPVTKQFNYTIGMVTIDTTKYFLDASNFYNAFGVLPIFCYNGYARIINESGASNQLSCNDFKDKNTQLIKITGITDSSYIAEIMDRKGRIEASYLRNVMGGQDTTIFEKYIRKRSKPFGGNIMILEGEAENLFDPEKDLVLKYTIRVTRPTNSDITLNTNILKFFTSNPFMAPERLLPVEFPTKYEYAYTLVVQVPPGMEAQLPPTITMGDVSIQGLETSHDISYNKKTPTLLVKTTLNIDRNSFAATEYGALKYFFDQVVSQENAVIILKNKAK